jgi:hypothetical protein
MMLSTPPYSMAACVAIEAYPSSLYVSRNTDSTSMYKQGYMGGFFCSTVKVYE